MPGLAPRDGAIAWSPTTPGPLRTHTTRSRQGLGPGSSQYSVAGNNPVIQHRTIPTNIHRSAHSSQRPRCRRETASRPQFGMPASGNSGSSCAVAGVGSGTGASSSVLRLDHLHQSFSVRLRMSRGEGRGGSSASYWRDNAVFAVLGTVVSSRTRWKAVRAVLCSSRPSRERAALKTSFDAGRRQSMTQHDRYTAQAEQFRFGVERVADGLTDHGRVPPSTWQPSFSATRPRSAEGDLVIGAPLSSRCSLMNSLQEGPHWRK